MKETPQNLKLFIPHPHPQATLAMAFANIFMLRDMTANVPWGICL